MASGLPDYYRGIRQRFGAAKRVADSVVLAAFGDETLCDVPGRGVIYGGMVYVSCVSTQATSHIEMYLDGTKIEDLPFGHMLYRGVVKPAAKPIYLIKYDEVLYLYVVGLTPGLTFEESFKLRYNEMDGGAPNVNYDVFYALI
jgi:hypothetical protein